jgi:Peptidase family S41
MRLSGERRHLTGVINWSIGKIYRAATLAAYLPVGGTIQAQRPAGLCVLDFDSTYVVITRDYAGYQDRLRENGPRITALTDSVRAAVRGEASDSTCTALLQRWIVPFAEHDHHLQLWQPRPDPAGQRAGAGGEDRRRPSLEFPDDSTAVLTLPDFAERYKPAIDSLIASHQARLLATPYLVVDVRRNGGGATRAYAQVVPLLYTNPIPRDGMELWVSEGNLAMARAMLDDPRTPPGMKAEAARLLPQLEKNLGRFFSMGEIDSLKLDTVYALPRAVAVLTGRGSASSCEQFVLDAMHSQKVTVFGTEHTAGFLDYGNIRTITLPSGIRRLAYATSRSHRLPERPMDYTGIVPHVLIPREDTDGLAFAIRYLKSRNTKRP